MRVVDQLIELARERCLLIAEQRQQLEAAGFVKSARQATERPHTGRLIERDWEDFEPAERRPRVEGGQGKPCPYRSGYCLIWPVPITTHL